MSLSLSLSLPPFLSVFLSRSLARSVHTKINIAVGCKAYDVDFLAQYLVSSWAKLIASNTVVRSIVLMVMGRVFRGQSPARNIV